MKTLKLSVLIVMAGASMSLAAIGSSVQPIVTSSGVVYGSHVKTLTTDVPNFNYQDDSHTLNLKNLNVSGTCSGCGGGGSGGSGIVSPATFTWQNNFGMSVSTLTVSTVTVTGEIIWKDGTVQVSSPPTQINYQAQINNLNTSTATLFANFPVSLSTNVTGSLPDSRLSSNVPLLNSTQTWTGQQLWKSPLPSTFTYAVNVGSITGAGLSTCGDGTHALSWTSATNLFGCQAITPGGGGSSSSLAVTTGTLAGFIGPPVSSPTAVINFNSSQFVGVLAGGATAFIGLNTSSVTLLGQDLSGSYLTTSSATTTYLQLSSATATYLNKNQATNGTVTNVTGTSPVNSSGGNTPAISLSQTIGQPETFTSSVTITAPLGSSTTYGSYFGSVTVNNLTASLPVQTDSNKQLTSLAIDLSGAQASGILAAARHPALTGDVTTVSGALATTLAKNQPQAVTWSSSQTVTATLGLNVTYGVTVGSVTDGDLSNSLPVQTDGSKHLISSAIDLSGTQATGILAAGRFPALTGDITTSAGSLATSAAAVQPNIKTLSNVVTITGSSLTVTGANGIASTYAVTAGSVTVNNLTASQYVKTDGNKQLASQSGVPATDVSGTLQAAQFPALTGAVTTAAGALATTLNPNQSQIVTWSSSQTVTAANGVAVTYNVNAGSMTGSGLSTCGDGTHALNWTSGTNLFGCQTLTSGGGGGASTLAVTTGTAAGFIGPPISSPTAVVNFNSSQFVAALTGGATAFVGLNTSSVTALGPDIDLSGAEVTGTLAAARFPALSGDVTTSAGSVATTLNSTIGTTMTWTGSNTYSNPSSTQTYNNLIQAVMTSGFPRTVDSVGTVEPANVFVSETATTDGGVPVEGIYSEAVGNIASGTMSKGVTGFNAIGYISNTDSATYTTQAVPGELRGGTIAGVYAGSGTINTGTGLTAFTQKKPSSHGVTTNLYAVDGWNLQQSAFAGVTNQGVFFAKQPLGTTGGNVTNQYGLYIEKQASTTNPAASHYGIYQADSGDQNIIFGSSTLTQATVSTLTVTALILNTASVTNSYTATSTATVILADATAGSLTVTLPTAVGVAGRVYTVKRTSSGANTVTVGTTSSQTIDGATTQVMTAQYTSIDVISDGSNWSIL